MNPAEKTDQIMKWIFDYLNKDFQYNKETIGLYRKILHLLITPSIKNEIREVDWDTEETKNEIKKVDCNTEEKIYIIQFNYSFLFCKTLKIAQDIISKIKINIRKHEEKTQTIAGSEPICLLFEQKLIQNSQYDFKEYLIKEKDPR